MPGHDSWRLATLVGTAATQPMWVVTPCHVRWNLASIVGATGSSVVDLLGDLIGVLLYAGELVAEA